MVVELSVNVAVTDRSCVMVTTHVPVLAHPLPVHPLKNEPDEAVAVSVTLAPLAKVAEQVEVQLLMPAGSLDTVPLPVPDGVTVSVYVSVLNVAVTDRAADIVTVQVPDAFVQSPLQPAKTEPVVGVAVRTTEVPSLKLAVQVAPQLMPAGLLVTVPVPPPPLVTDRV